MTNPASVRLHNCACLADADGFYDAAIAMWRRALAIDHGNVAAMAGLGLVLLTRGEEDDAVNLACSALAREPSAWAHTILARYHTIHGNLDQALSYFDHALILDPHTPERLFDVAATWMRMGDWEKGWPLHTAANRGDGKGGPLPPFPRWQGQEVDRLLVVGRLGFGDQILYSRFLPWARERARHVDVLATTLQEPLYAPYIERGLVRLCTPGEGVYDAQIEEFALPDLCGCRPDTIPQSVSARASDLTKGKLKVGIVWSGSDKTATNLVRRVPFETMLSLAEDPRLEIYSFQTGRYAGDIAKAHAQLLVTDLSGRIEWDWSLTADALSKMDLVVAPDCGTVHLAAAMGIPTFVLLCAYPDWRWLMHRSDSPWFPSVRLFRQKRFGEWAPVMAEVRAAIDELGSRKQEAA